MKNKFALWSFILGIISIIMLSYSKFIVLITIFFAVFPLIGQILALFFFLILPILSLVFSIIGIKKSKEQGGLVFAIIGIIFAIFAILYFLSVFLLGVFWINLIINLI